MTFVVMAAIRPVYTSLLPLPVWRTPWQPDMFLRGAAIGFVLPFLATAWPVWRAVRVMPVDAITTTHASARSGLAPMLRRLRWPVSAFRRMPLGNVLRAPRRTILTALGIGAAITTLVVVLGMLDSFSGHDGPQQGRGAQLAPRPCLGHARPVRRRGRPGAAPRSRPRTRSARCEPVLRLGATLSTPDHESFPVALDAVDLDQRRVGTHLREGRTR